MEPSGRVEDLGDLVVTNTVTDQVGETDVAIGGQEIGTERLG